MFHLEVNEIVLVLFWGGSKVTQQIKELVAKPEPPPHPEFDTQHFHLAKSYPLTSTQVLWRGRWGVLSLSLIIHF